VHNRWNDHTIFCSFRFPIPFKFIPTSSLPISYGNESKENTEGLAYSKRRRRKVVNPNAFLITAQEASWFGPSKIFLCSVKSDLGVKLEIYLSTNLEKEHKFHSTF
jgi:hypothetical protein